MARPLRIQYPNAVYHVMNRGLAQTPIFRAKQDYEMFLQVVDEAWQRWQFELHAYCLMGNHYHLCLKTPEAKLARIMRQINGVYTQRFNRAHRRDGPLFRGRYKAMLIEAEEYLGSVVRYIHLNPVQAKLVQNPQDYSWSSHKDYLARKTHSWLSTKTLMEWFDSRAAFHEFVQEGNPETIEKFYARKRLPIILGRENFIERIRLRTPKPSRAHVQEECRFVRPSVEKILEAVALAWDVPIRVCLNGRRGEKNLARKVALWSLRQFGDYTYRQIADIVGLGSERTVGWACDEIKREAQSSQLLQRRLKAIDERISQQRT